MKAFGIENVETRSELSPFQSQVDIVDYVNGDNFIILLKTVGGQKDEILLAKIPPAATLGETWRIVDDRIKARSFDRGSARLRQVRLFKFLTCQSGCSPTSPRSGRRDRRNRS